MGITPPSGGFFIWSSSGSDFFLYELYFLIMYLTVSSDSMIIYWSTYPHVMLNSNPIAHYPGMDDGVRY